MISAMSRRRTAIIALVAVFCATAPAQAAPGDAYVADQSAAPGSGAIFRVDPATGERTVIASGGQLADPWGVVATRANRIFVADIGFNGPRANVFRINPISGAKIQLPV